MESEVRVYGMDWCGLTFGVREYLTTARVEYEYYDVERDPQAFDVALALSIGRRRFPLVVVYDRILMNPSRVELQRVLTDYRIRPEVDAPQHGAAPVPSRRR
jgi:glutaredoxin